MASASVNSAAILQDADNDTKIQVEESTDEDTIRMDIAGTEKMVVNSTGVGIGQVPTRDLSLHAGDASSVFAHFTNTDTGTTSSDGVIIGLGASEDLVLSNQESSKNIIFENGGSEAMRINSSGNAVFSGNITFGDGHVLKNGGGDNLTLESSSSENIVINSAGGIHVFQDNGTERMRITAGDVLVGKTVTTLSTAGIHMQGSTGRTLCTVSGDI